MKRDPALIPLSHDHQHALASALRLRRAAAGADHEQLVQEVAAFLAFARRELLPHLEDEERTLAPVLLSAGVRCEDAVTRMLLEHARVRSLLRDLEQCSEERLDDELLTGCAQRLAEYVTNHVRWEERELFELAQCDLPASELQAMELPSRDATDWPGTNVLQLRDPTVIDGIASSLTATPIDLPPHGERAAWTAERDVVLVLVRGDLKLTINGVSGALLAPSAVLVPAGAERILRAGPRGALIVSSHALPPPALPDRHSRR